MDERLVYYDLEQLGKDRIIKAVEEAVSKDGRISIALIFGSALKRARVRDIDVAVHADPKLDLYELIGLGSRLEELLGVPVDVSSLTELAPCMRYRVMAEGARVVADMKLFSEMLGAAFSECQDLKLMVISSRSIKGCRGMV